MHFAAECGCHDSLAALLAAHAPASMADAASKMPLHYAVTAGNSNVVEKLLAVGADVNAADDEGATPLICATRLGDAGMVRVLLEASAQPQASAAGGWSALHIAANSGCSDVVRLLLSHGAPVGATLMATLDPPLHLAVKRKDTATIQLLLAAGAAVDATGADGRSVLCMAALTGDLPTVECLLQRPFFNTAAATEAKARSVVAAAQATTIDEAVKQSVVLRLLSPTASSSPAAIKAALQQCLQPLAGGATAAVSGVLLAALLATEVADLEQQRAGVQQLIVGMAGMHKQQQAELQAERQHRAPAVVQQERPGASMHALNTVRAAGPAGLTWHAPGSTLPRSVVCHSCCCCRCCCAASDALCPDTCKPLRGAAPSVCTTFMRSQLDSSSVVQWA